VAPITVGAGATVGAGSTVTRECRPAVDRGARQAGDGARWKRPVKKK